MTGLHPQGLTDELSIGADDLADNRHALSRYLMENLPPEGHPLAASAHHHFANTGKLLRGMTALLSAQALGVSAPAALAWALAVEFMHNASLVHDDICDHDVVRRNRESVWKVFGIQQAICFGDWLVAESFRHAAQADSLAKLDEQAQTGRVNAGADAASCVALLSGHMAALSTGQAAEFIFDTYPDWAGYQDIVAQKTMPLMLAPVEGAIHLRGDVHDSLKSEGLQAIKGIFACLGLAYQIANDVKNFLGTDGARRINGDLHRRAPNAVMVLFRDGLVNGSLHEFDDWLLAAGSETEARIENSNTADDADHDWPEKVMSVGIPQAVAQMNLCLANVDDYLPHIPARLADVLFPLTVYLSGFCEQVGSDARQTGA